MFLLMKFFYTIPETKLPLFLPKIKKQFEQLSFYFIYLLCNINCDGTALQRQDHNSYSAARIQYMQLWNMLEYHERTQTASFLITNSYYMNYHVCFCCKSVCFCWCQRLRTGPELFSVRLPSVKLSWPLPSDRADESQLPVDRTHTVHTPYECFRTPFNCHMSICAIPRRGSMSRGVFSHSSRGFVVSARLIVTETFDLFCLAAHCKTLN